MIGDYLRLSINTLKVRKLRTSLTMLGIFIGIAAVVALISLGQGMQEAINDQFEKVGINRVMIMPGGSQFGPPGGSLSVAKLTEDDFELIRDVRGIEKAQGIYGETIEVSFHDEVLFTSVWGGYTDSDALEFMGEIDFFDIEYGRELRDGDDRHVVLGYNVANKEFDEKIEIGDRIEIDGDKFTVVGIQKKAGTGIHDQFVRITMDTAREIFNETDEISQIFTSSGNEEPGIVAERVEKALRKAHDVDEGEEDFTVQTSEQSIRQLTDILNIIQVFLVGIAAISLFVGGVGIMNTMYTAVMEKTSEIGVMKAVGAKNSHIFSLFLMESGMLGLAGGIVGVVIGLTMSKSVEIIAKQMDLVEIFKASTSLYLIFGALLFSFLVGGLSGVFPAMQASKLHPVEAIRKR
ncbi:ABC transporter permease [Nanoarchaeota archaeon]